MSVPLEDRIFAQLSGYAPLVALVGQSISFGKAEQETALPYVEFTLIGTGYDYTQDGPTNLNDRVVQFDCWADDPDKARAANREVLNALGAGDSPAIQFYAFIENDGTDTYDEEFRIHRCMSMARVWYSL